MVHELKTLPKYFKKLVDHSKSFEVRKDDRNFQVGDWLKLREYDIENKKYTGDYLMAKILYILGRNEDEKIFVPNGYVILGLEMGIVDNSKFPRAEVMKFANAMEKELKENDYKGGWKDCNLVFLADKLYEEVQELIYEAGRDSKKRILSEAADVGNIAMMIADINGALEEWNK